MAEKFEQRPSTFILWINDNKNNINSPDVSGTLVLRDGTQVRIAGWKKKSTNGKRFISGRVTYQDEDEPARRVKAQPQPEPPKQDDIPF